MCVRVRVPEPRARARARLRLCVCVCVSGPVCQCDSVPCAYLSVCVLCLVASVRVACVRVRKFAVCPCGC